MENSNSPINQEIKAKFVNREVLTCFSCEMQEVLSAEIVSYEDMENLYINTCPHCSEQFDNNVDICPHCGEDGHIEELEQEQQEIMEWWIVTDYLHRKLSEKGEPVLEWGNNYYWGRCCSGQAIMLDSVISEICSAMEILEGQKNEWKI